MTLERWRTVFASVAGTSHAKTSTPCQDAGRCSIVTTTDGDEILVAAVADGAGTAYHSEVGAALAVERFIRDFGQAAQDDPTLARIDRAFAEGWIIDFCEAVGQLAVDEGHQARDYACTLLGAVVGCEAAIYVQIGDGAIIVAGEEPGEYGWITWPQHGEYANTTNFVIQDDACKVLSFDRGRAVSEIALFTDGIERLVLDHSAHVVHAPAFRPIFEWLAQMPPGATEQPSEILAAYLGSDHVNRRTDDDKTLVMATRAKYIGSG